MRGPKERGENGWRQGILCQSEAGRDPADPDRGGEPLYVQCAPRLYGRLHPVVQAGGGPVPDRLSSGHHSDSGTDGGDGVGPPGPGAYALYRRGAPNRRDIRHGHLHPGQYPERGVYGLGGCQHNAHYCPSRGVMAEK